MMYEELIQRLRETSMDFGQADHVSVMLLEAAFAIEELEKAVPRWIPVTERLPEEYDRYYLVVLNNWNTDFCLYTKEKGFGMYITPKWWDANDEVTHWMPLPEPTKEELK